MDLHDLNDLINAKSPLNKGHKFSTSTTPIPPAIYVSKNMQKKITLDTLNDVEHR